MRRVIGTTGTLPAKTAPSISAAAQNKREGWPSAGHLAELVEKWAKERKPQPRSVGIANKVIERFYTMVGRIPVSAITRRHAVDFKDSLLSSGQTPTNTDKQLTMLSVLLNYAAANLLTETNVARGIKVAERKNAKAVRIPFDLSALNAIFSSPIYTEGFRPKGCAGAAAYWVPLLALYTGARIEELCQLRPEDIYEDSYRAADDNEIKCWVLRITGAEDSCRGGPNRPTSTAGLIWTRSR